VMHKANYDETTEEPSVLPAAFPNLLVNGASGIAVGMATNIPPHNLTEILNGLLAITEKPGDTAAEKAAHMSLDEMMTHVTGPDFPTGGRISKSGIREAYLTGHSGLKVRGKARIEEKNGRNMVIISEIPYQVNKTNLIQTISQMYKAGKIPDISALRDESDRKDPVRIVVELKRGAIPTLVLNQLYKYTQLQTTYTVMNLSIVDGQPRVLPLVDTMMYFLAHRADVVTRRTEYEVKQARARAHVLEGVLKALDHIEEVIALIRRSNTGAEAKDSLMQRFTLSDIQSQAILDMRLQRLTGLERGRLQAEFDELMVLITRLQSILGDKNLLWREIRREFRELREKYGDERRTVITELEEDINKEDLIAVEDMVITMTRAGYLKRTNLANYREQKRGGRGASGGKLRDEDINTRVFVGSTHDYLLFFTDAGRVFHEKIYDLPEAGRDAKGSHIRNLLPGLRDEENIASVLSVHGFEQAGCFVFATKNGVIKKTEITDYGNISSAGLIAINLQTGDELIGVGIVQDGDHVVLATRNGKAMRFDSAEVRDTGRATQGVIGIRLREDESAEAGRDAVVSMTLVPGGDDQSELLAVSEYGLGKRTPVGDYPSKGRGGMGVITLDVTEKTGALVALTRVGGNEELMVLTQKGTVIRTRVDDIRVTGRNAQGVRVINVQDKDRVISAFSIPREDEL
jgi:DNA gyrase subunit A